MKENKVDKAASEIFPDATYETATVQQQSLRSLRGSVGAAVRAAIKYQIAAAANQPKRNKRGLDAAVCVIKSGGKNSEAVKVLLDETGKAVGGFTVRGSAEDLICTNKIWQNPEISKALDLDLRFITRAAKIRTDKIKRSIERR